MPTSLLCGGDPISGDTHFGFFTIPQGDQWEVVASDGAVDTVDGPKTLQCFGQKLTKRRKHVVHEKEYLEVRYVDGHSEVIPGPACLFEDPLRHQSIISKPAISIGTNECILVYREDVYLSPTSPANVAKATAASKAKALEGAGAERSVSRELIHGPLLYKPKSATEWMHKFDWHGHDPRAPDGLARKIRGGLKFDTMRMAPTSTYYDVEGVRTADDALLTVRLMLFYQVTDVEKLVDSTNDPIADMINSAQSDVISFCAARSFEQFKETAEQLNAIGVYQNLTASCESRGIAIAKVVFRGYLAPQRLQKMHDDAIERRTRLVLERESEVQEQKLQDDRLAKEEERDKVKRGMQKAQAEHTAEMQRTAFEAKQREKREAAEQETALLTSRQQAELAHLAKMRADLELEAKDVSQLLVAREQGAPSKLIQVVGDARAAVQVRDG